MVANLCYFQGKRRTKLDETLNLFFFLLLYGVGVPSAGLSVQVAAGALAGQSRTLDYLGVDFLMAPSVGAGAGN